MSEEVEKIKKLVAFKKKLEKRAGELESEIKELQRTLKAVNIMLFEET